MWNYLGSYRNCECFPFRLPPFLPSSFFHPSPFIPHLIPSLTLSSEIYEVWTGGFLRATEGRSTHFGYPEYVCYQLLRITKLAFEGRGKPQIIRMKIVYNLIVCRCRFLHLPYNYYHTHSHVDTHIHTHKVLTL